MNFDNVNVNVSGGQSIINALQNYNTIILKPNIIDNRNVLIQEMISEKHTKYIIKWNYSLEDAIINVPKDCIIEFAGGTIDNGTIVGDNTILIYSKPIDEVCLAERQGTFIYNTTVADEEDITSESGKLKFKDRPATNGIGKKILRKNIVNGKNILTQDMINESNTIYEIIYNFDLNGEVIEIKDGCTLKFSNGGNCKNGTLWLHGKNITLCGGECEAQIKVGLTDEEIGQAYNGWFNSNYNITIRDISLVNKLNQNAVRYMNSLGDSFDYFNSRCAIELKNVIGVNILNCSIIDYEVGIKYSATIGYRQAVARVNILNNVIKHSYCCILTKSENLNIHDFGDTTISNNELFAVKTCCNINHQDGLVFTNNTLYCVVAEDMGTNNIAVSVTNVYNTNISNNQIFAGQIGLKIEGDRSNYTIVQGNNFISNGKLLSETYIPNAYCILCKNFKGALNIVGNMLAPEYVNKYIALIDSQFPSLIIDSNSFKANAEDIGKSVEYDNTYSVYNPYFTENIKITNFSKIQDIVLDFKSFLGFDYLDRKIVFNIPYEYLSKETVNIEGRHYTFNTIYDDEFLVLFDYGPYKTLNPSNGGNKIMFIACDNKVIKINVTNTDTYEDKFINISNKLKENGISNYLDTDNSLLYVKAKGGIKFIKNVSDNGREVVRGVMGGNIIDYANTPLPDYLIRNVYNIRSIDFGFINADRYIDRSIINERNEKELKIKLTKKSTLTGTRVAIMPYIATIITKNGTNPVDVLKNLYNNGVLKEGIQIDNDGVLTIPRKYNSGIIFSINNSLDYTNIQSPIDYSTISEKYLTNIFAFKRLYVHSSTLDSIGYTPAGKYVFLYDKKKPAYYYEGKWYYPDGNVVSINTRGTFEQKPTLEQGLEIGFAYFCTNRRAIESTTDGIMIYYKGNNVWVDALGRVIS